MARSNLILRRPVVIDTTVEELITFSEAAKLVPSRHPGRKLSVTTVWRWAEFGVQGIKLESIYFGGSRYTTREAVRRFGMAVTAARQGDAPAPPPRPVSAGRRRELDRVNRELDRVGIVPDSTRAARPKRRVAGS